MKIREIKCKAKRLDNKEWVYGFIARVQDDDGIYKYYIKEDTTLHVANVKQTTFQIIPETICQFIGLTDGKYNDVYENDILSTIGETGHLDWKVCWENRLAGFGIRNLGDNGYTGDFFGIDSSYYFEDRHVTGNIHD